MGSGVHGNSVLALQLLFKSKPTLSLLQWLIHQAAIIYEVWVQYPMFRELRYHMLSGVAKKNFFLIF